jgi:FG-GAP repeat/FlgD Ig-like domain
MFTRNFWILAASCCAVVALIGGFLIADPLGGRGGEGSRNTDSAVVSTTPDLPVGASPEWLAEVSKNLTAREYQISAGDSDLQAPNRAQNLRTTFSENGISVQPRDLRVADWSWSWTLAAWGREDRLETASGAQRSHDLCRVEYLRPDIIEWYENGEQGLEQGFTIDAPPAGEGRLCFEGAIGGNLQAEYTDADEAIDFFDENNARVLRYSKLVAWDAAGRELPGEMLLAENTIRISVDDYGAEYPITVDPLLSTPDKYVECEQGLSDFGNCVATAGDVNGDGYSDVIVGAMSLGTNHGGAYLYLGSASGIDTDYSWHEYGEDAYNNMGQSVSTAGDVNGDGYDDIIIGEPFYTGTITDQGRAYVYYGGPAGPASSADWDVAGVMETGRLGWSVSTAGDVNNDGYDDVIIGARDESLAYVYHGSASGLSLSWNWRGGESIPDTDFGYSVATAGDVNGDGYDDVVVGAPYYHTGGTFGHVYVYHGSASGVNNSPAWDVGGTDSFSYFGWTVAGAGDVNGDGYSEVIVGAQIYSGDVSLEGAAFLYEGSSTGLSTTADWTGVGGQNNSRYGSCVATAGDVNGDGYSDVVVSAYLYANGEDDEGRVYLYLGDYGGLSTSATWRNEGDEETAWYGASSAAAGDVNGDGFGDLIIGIPNYGPYPEYGRAEVFHGQRSDARFEAGWVTESNQADAHFGGALAGVGDANGDGFGDVLVGASAYDNGQVDEGAIFLFLGTQQGLAWIPSWWAESNQAGAYLGVSVANAGDVNGDGYPDAIVGAPGYMNTHEDEGAAFVWLSVPGGAPMGTPANAAWIGYGGQTNADYGFSVSGGGDFNGDGYSDIVVGAPYYDAGQTDEGAAFAYFGSATGPSVTHDWFHGSDHTSAEYGLAVAAGGDFNGDGYGDVFVGAPKYYSGETWEGYAFVYLGSEDGPQTGAPWWHCKSQQTGARLGRSVAWAGDVNGDGFSDVITGAFRYDYGGDTDAGRVFVWHGSDTQPPMGEPGNEDYAATIAQASANTGYSVASAGDVNGDGFSDIIFGAPYFDWLGDSGTGMAVTLPGSADGVTNGVFWDWFTVGNQVSCYHGWSVASAGDVNGDGFSDVLVGSPYYDSGQDAEGRAFLYYGNDSRGLSRTPEQWRSDFTAPIVCSGVSDSESAFGLKARGRVPAGRGQVRLEYEVERFGTPFDGAGTVLGAWTDTGVPAEIPGSVVDLSAVVSGLSSGTQYHWRLRFLTDNPYFPRSPWLTTPMAAASEAHLRTAGGSGSPVGDLPARALALRNYPNPFNPRTKLEYRLMAPVHVRLDVYDLRGRLVQTLVDETQLAGPQAVMWEGQDDSGRAMASGVYFARLRAGEMVWSRKMLLAR